MQHPSLTALACCALLIGCAPDKRSPDPPADGRGDDIIFTTFYPTTYFAGRISGGLVPVRCPLPADADPIFWQPPRDAIAAYQEAGLIILNGASFEKWVETVSLPKSRTMDSAAAFKERFLRYEEAVVHRHGPKGEHSHEGIDGHTWLDPQLAIEQSDAILRAMQGRWPEHAAAFAENHAGLAGELASLHDLLRQIEPPPLLASHPAYNYIARSYRWDIDNLDLDPEEMPTEAQLEDLRARLAKRPVSHLLWESLPSPEIAARLQSEFGLASVLFSPCEAAPESGDYLAVMRANIERLAALAGSAE